MRVVFLAAIAAAFVAGAAAFLLSPRNLAVTRLLVIPEPPASGDRALQLKGAEAMARQLGRLALSADFFSQVASRAPQETAAAFTGDDAARRNGWRHAVRAKANSGGVLEISIGVGDSEQASRLAQAAADSMVARGGDYLGGRLDILVIDAPEIVRWPGVQRIPLAVVLGGVFGTAAGLSWHRLRPKRT